jgi:hypothetical protein
MRVEVILTRTAFALISSLSICKPTKGARIQSLSAGDADFVPGGRARFLLKDHL